MKRRNPMRWWVGGLLMVAASCAPCALAEPQTAEPAAGKITAMVPSGSVEREKKQLEAKKDLALFWKDKVQTDRGGRARVRLEDGSILNVGSQASLIIRMHDPGKQQTDLDLIYGKVRADVTKIASPDGHFEIRTKVAVCGVVGTEEYLEANDLATTVIALGGGQVSVSSSNSSLGGTVLLNPGETTSVIAGRPPNPKRLATPQEMTKAVAGTEAETPVALDPGTSTAGRTFEAKITGSQLKNTQGLSFGQPGLSVQISGEITATQIPVTITVAAGVPAGAYSLSINKPDGPAHANLVIASQPAIQAGQDAAATSIQMPASQTLSVTQGAKIPLDASNTHAPAGTQIVAYQWSILNTTFSGNGSTYGVNTSLLAPGNYTVQLTVVNDQGKVGTQQYPLTIDAGVQPQEIVRNLASAYESLQPGAFLKNFDEERFRNYAGFAAAIEDSFRSQLETIRVFQRPVNCAVIQVQDEAICQAEFQLQFTKKDQQMELLDAMGNPIPPGTTPPPNATLGKRILKGSEQDTIRFQRGDRGWKVTDYSSVVSCPGGGSTNGVNVGSCVLAIGSPTAPSFQISNLQLFSTDLPLGGSVSGTFTVVPNGGFSNSVSFSGQGQVGNQSVTVQFTPNPAGPMATVNFTVFAPTTAPTGVTGAAPFTLVINGQDSSGTVTATANTTLVLQPDFSLALQPATTPSTPTPVTQNSMLPLTVQIVSTGGFTGTAFIDFPNLPAGFNATPGNLTAGTQATFPVAISAAAFPGPASITVRATLSSGQVRTATLFLNVVSDFTLSVTPVSSQANPAHFLTNGTLQVGVTVNSISGFASTVAIDFPNLPPGITGTGGTVAAGATATFAIQNTLTPSATVLQITVRGHFGTDVQTSLLFVQIVATLPIAHGLTNATATVYAADPPKLTAGQVVEGKLYGSNLSGVTAVQVSGSGIKAELLEARPSELHVRFTADPGLEAGSRLIAVLAGGKKATFAIDVSAVAGKLPAGPLLHARQSSNPAQTANSSSAVVAPNSNKVSDSPNPSADSTDQDDRNAWRGDVAASKTSTRFAVRQRGELQLTVGSCAGFRLTSGTAQSCGGTADFEVSSQVDRGAMVIEAEGVRNLGGVSLDQAEAAQAATMESSVALVAGGTYLVQSRHGLAIMRVVQIRGIESVRNAPPAALRGPRMGGLDIRAHGGASRPELTLVLEWKLLQP